MRKFFVLLFCCVFLAFSAPVAEPATQDVVVKVNGLVCDFCAIALEKVFKRKDEVADIKVDLTEKTVRIIFQQGKALTDEVIRQGVTDAGYVVVGIER